MRSEFRTLPPEWQFAVNEIFTLVRKASYRLRQRGYKRKDPKKWKAYQANWYEANKDRHKALRDEYRAAHPDRVKKANDAWKAKNPHYHRDWSRRKRAEKRNAAQPQ